MVSRSMNLGANYTLSKKNALHLICISYTQDNFRDYNIVSGALNNNNSMTELLSYSISPTNHPLGISLTLSNFENTNSFARLRMRTVNLGADYGFFKRKLTTSIGLDLSQNIIGNETPNNQILILGGIKYKLLKSLTFKITGSINTYKFGSEKPGASFKEDFLRISLVYKF